MCWKAGEKHNAEKSRQKGRSAMLEQTRRGFIKTVGAGGIAGAIALGAVNAGNGMALAAESSNGADNTSSTTSADAGSVATNSAGGAEPVAVYTADVCVVGGGNSGLAAAVEAAQNGMGVVLLEKQGSTGGGGVGTEGVFAVGSDMQKEAGIEIEPAEVIATEMEYSHNRANGQKWLDMIHASGDNVSWLKDCGVNFTGVVDDYHGGKYKTFHWFGENRAHDDYTPAMTKTAEDLGVEILTWTPATSLLQDDNGAIRGVLAEKQNGDVIEVDAPAVILATGGFANNDEYLQEGGFSDTTDVVRFLYGFDGDGVRMAEEVGGADNIPRMSGLMQLTVSGAPGGEYGTFGQGDGLVVAGHAAQSIWINEYGERFCAESSGVENWMADMIPSLVHARLYSIYDAKIFKDAFDGMIAPRIDWEATQQELAERIEENPYNDFFSADTLDELIEKACDACGLDPDTVKKTVDDYQAMCDAGADSDFGKPVEYLQKLENPPYYFCRMPQACMVTFGGIRTNREMEVVDKAGKAIAGLYSCGVDSADLWPNVYTINVPGGCNANNISSGRFAGKHAAEYVGDAKAGSVASTGDTSASSPDVSWPAPDGSWADGSYTDTERGMFGDITVTVTIEGGKITDVSQENELETSYVGVAAMEEVLIPAVIDQQTCDVDTVAGATMTSNGFRTAVQKCLEEATGK